MSEPTPAPAVPKTADQSSLDVEQVHEIVLVHENKGRPTAQYIDNLTNLSAALLTELSTGGADPDALAATQRQSDQVGELLTLYRGFYDIREMAELGGFINRVIYDVSYDTLAKSEFLVVRVYAAWLFDLCQKMSMAFIAESVRTSPPTPSPVPEAAEEDETKEES